MRPQHQPDRRARLGVGHLVGQVIVHGEPLAPAQRADAAGDVHAPLRHIVPQRLAGLVERCIARLAEPRRPCPMRYMARTACPSAVLLAHRQVRLAIVIAAAVIVVDRVLATSLGLAVIVVRQRAALVHKELAERQIAPLTRRLVELDQRQLDLLMARIAALLPLSGAEHAVDIVGIAPHDAEEPVLAGGLIVRHCRLDQVSGAAELVAVAQVAPTVLGLDHLVVELR